MDVVVDVTCPRCGDQEVPVTALRCGMKAGEPAGFCEFACPLCRRLVLLRTTGSGAAGALERGAGRMGPTPFELLEPHDGSPLSADDLLDLVAGLQASCCPQELAA